MAKKSRIDAWSLMKILVVPCLFLCAIFKHPAFQWIAAGALALWVCFMLAEIIRPRIRKRKNPTVGQKQEAAKEHQELPTLPPEADDDTKLSLLRQVNHRVMEQLKQSYPTVAWLWRLVRAPRRSARVAPNASSSITVTPSILGR